MWWSIIWQNKRIIGEILGLALACFASWWFFIHNPKVISELENDKAELARQVEAGKQALQLLNDIQKGKGRINAQTQSQISSVRSAAIPRRAVLIRNGGLLQALPAVKTAH